MIRAAVVPGCTVARTPALLRALLALLESMHAEPADLPWYCCGAMGARLLGEPARYAAAFMNLLEASLRGHTEVVFACPRCGALHRDAVAWALAHPDGWNECASFLLEESMAERHRPGAAPPSPRALPAVKTLTEWYEREGGCVSAVLRERRAALFEGCTGKSVGGDAGAPAGGPAAGERRAAGFPPCCGADHATSRPDIAETLAGRITGRCAARGEKLLATPCPHCASHLLRNARLRREDVEVAWLPLVLAPAE